MLTGRQAFHGESVGDVLASVIAREPDLNLISLNVNPCLQELLQRCLQKNPKRRWQAVGDLRAELETIAPRSVATPASSITYSRPLWRRVSFPERALGWSASILRYQGVPSRSHCS